MQIPLIPLPLPNVTIYFTIWRIISNRSAGKGGVREESVVKENSLQQTLFSTQPARTLQKVVGTNSGSHA